jgi:hypothetical protein
MLQDSAAPTRRVGAGHLILIILVRHADTIRPDAALALVTLNRAVGKASAAR